MPGCDYSQNFQILLNGFHLEIELLPLRAFCLSFPISVLVFPANLLILDLVPPENFVAIYIVTSFHMLIHLPHEVLSFFDQGLALLLLLFFQLHPHFILFLLLQLLLDLLIE